MRPQVEKSHQFVFLPLKMAVATPQRRFWITVSACMLALIWVLSLLSSSRRAGQNVESQIRNRTLGFGEILMAVLPARTDQKDAAALLSHYSDIDVTIMDGVTNVSRIALPPGTGSAWLNDGELGCWRAHMNMLRRVVEKKLATALIVEGDVDWDVRIKDQLVNLSENLPDSSSDRPYGDSWMYLWLGNCDHVSNPQKKGPFVSYSDETVGAMEDQYDFVKNDYAYYGVKEDNMRVISPAFKMLCTTAYAVTFEGALRMLYEIGHDHLNKAIDVEYRVATMKGKLPGLSVNPPLLSQWKTGLASDSAIRNSKAKNITEFKVGSGPQVRQSVRERLKEKVYEATPLGWAHV